MSFSSAVFGWEQAGYNGAAASYLITALADPQLSSAWDAAAAAATGRPTDSVGNVAPVASLTWDGGGIARVSDLPGNLAAALSSVVNQAVYFQTGGHGQAPVAMTGPASTPSSSAGSTSATLGTTTSTAAAASRSTSRSASSSASSLVSSSSAAISSAIAAASSSSPSSSSSSSSSATATAASEDTSSSSGLSPTGRNAAIAVPIVVVACLLALLALLFWRRRQNGKSSFPAICGGRKSRQSLGSDPESFREPKAHIQTMQETRQIGSNIQAGPQRDTQAYL